MIKVTIGEKECLGCGLCNELAPEIFFQQNDKSVVNSNANLEDKDNQELIRKTVKACPVGAIKMRI